MNTIKKNNINTPPTHYGIPKGWEEIEVGKLGEIFKGKGVTKAEIKESGLPCLTYGDLYTKYNYYFEKTVNFIDSDSAEQSQEIITNDILFAGSGETAEEIGKCAAYIGKQNAYAGGDIIILRPYKTDAICLSHILNDSYAVKQKSILGQGHSVVHIYPKDIAKLKILLPPLPEQRKIAAILSTCDKAIETTQKLITAKEQLKKGLMQQLLTGKKRPKEFATDKWKVSSLENHCEFQNGFAFDSDCFSLNTGLRLIRNRDLKNDDVQVYFNGKYPKEYLVENNDLLIGMDGDFIPCLWNKGEALLNQRVGRLINFKNDIDKIFLFYYLVSHLRDIENVTSSTTVKHLSGKDVMKIKIKLPLIKEQQKIASILTGCDKEIQLLKTQFQKQKDEKKGLMQVLLTGKKRIK